MLYLKIIACKSMFRELSIIAAESTNIIDFTWFSWGLHDLVGELNACLKKELEIIDSGKDHRTSYPPYGRPFDAVLLAYGLCSNGIVGLSSSKYPLVIPRAHDCITLLLGSKERYRELFDENGGTYWFSNGWIENSPLPGKKEHEAMVRRYSDKYDLETAEYMTTLYDEGWRNNYSRLGRITWPEFDNAAFNDANEAEVRECQEELDWRREDFVGDSTLLRDFINGNWDDERFLLVPTGKTVEASYRDDIIEIAEDRSVS